MFCSPCFWNSGDVCQCGSPLCASLPAVIDSSLADLLMVILAGKLFLSTYLNTYLVNTVQCLLHNQKEPIYVLTFPSTSGYKSFFVGPSLTATTLARVLKEK